MDDYRYSVIGRRLREALKSVSDEEYINLRKITCERLQELYENTIVVRGKVNKVGTRPKLGKEDITGVKHEEDESDREDVKITYSVNRSECDDILNDALDLDCPWAFKILRKLGKFKVIDTIELKPK